MTQNQIAFKNAKELERHNQMMEVENERHNKVEEAYKKWQNQINALSYQESVRANLAKESENRRTNEANEEIKRQQNAINAANLTESVRHSQATEQLTAEIQRSQAAVNAATASRQYAEADVARGELGVQQATSTKLYNEALNAAEQAKTEKEKGKLTRAQTQTEYKKPSNIASETNVNQARVGQIQVQTVKTGVDTFWSSVQSALNFITGAGAGSYKIRNMSK